MSDYTPGLYGSSPEFGDDEIELNHGLDWILEIDKAKKALLHSLGLLEALRDEWEQDIDLKTGVQGSYHEVKSDQLKVVEEVVEVVDDAVRQMGTI